jgi:hypothetical protein
MAVCSKSSSLRRVFAAAAFAALRGFLLLLLLRIVIDSIL